MLRIYAGNLPADYRPADSLEEEDQLGFAQQWRTALGRKGWIGDRR